LQSGLQKLFAFCKWDEVMSKFVVGALAPKFVVGALAP